MSNYLSKFITHTFNFVNYLFIKKSTFSVIKKKLVFIRIFDSIKPT